jgi:hypothetical protein
MGAETIETRVDDRPDFDNPEFVVCIAARKAFSIAHSKWMAALAELAALNASPDANDANEAAFSEVVEAAHKKRRNAISQIMDTPPQGTGPLLMKFAVLEDVAMEQLHTMPGSDSPLLALVASVKADVLRQAM